jgi:MFS family permease
MRQPRRAPVALAYAAFVLVGVNAGVNGVLLAAQMDDYAVSRATLGLTFFASSAGFVLAGVTAGALVHRFGTRIAVATGGGVYVFGALYAGTRPAFVAFVVLQIACGYAVGVLESVLNAYLSALPNATTLLNRLHGFFGIGALLGPPLATWIVASASWPTVMLLLGAATVPLTAGFLIVIRAPSRIRPRRSRNRQPRAARLASRCGSRACCSAPRCSPSTWDSSWASGTGRSATSSRRGSRPRCSPGTQSAVTGSDSPWAGSCSVRSSPGSASPRPA